MKTKTVTFSSIIAISIILGACGNTETTEVNHEHHNGGSESSASTASSIISPIIQHYINLKNGLVAANLEEAKSGAKAMIVEINKVNISAFSSEQKTIWNEQIEKTKENLEHIIKTTELAHQREHLGPLSEGIYSLVKIFGGGTTLYYDFCPMANENEGGYWLSENEEIKNPYFGDEMLECGKVKETLK